MGTKRLVGILLIAGGLWSLPAVSSAADPTPPPQPAMNELGGEGPCGQSQLVLTNLDAGSVGQLIWVFQPTGAAAPRTGGTCADNRRPVIFFAHGYSGIVPYVYRELINNMVSNGNIVVFANYTLLAHPTIAYRQADAGFRQAAANFLVNRRMDLANIGIWGHSYGAGMTPWLAQQAGYRGWGSQSLWLTVNSSFYSFKTGFGPIGIPAHARVQVVGYDNDGLDNRIGIEVFEALQVPDSQKDHITMLSDGAIETHHLVPVTWALTTTYAEDHLDYFGVYRNWQALSECARTGLNCDVDLSYMGTWSDGHEAPHAIVSDDPVDIGPAGTECGVPFLPGLFFPPVRPCP